jgi:hypothetical protein
MLDQLPPAASASEPAPPDLKRPRFPKWTLVEQDLWIDMLDGYSNTLLQGKADENISEEEGAALVRLAAVLADVAIQETGYRFWIQKPPVKTRRNPHSRGPRGTVRRR